MDGLTRYTFFPARPIFQVIWFVVVEWGIGLNNYWVEGIFNLWSQTLLHVCVFCLLFKRFIIFYKMKTILFLLIAVCLCSELRDEETMLRSRRLEENSLGYPGNSLRNELNASLRVLGV